MTTTGATWQPVGRSDDLPEKGMIGVEVGNINVAVYRVDGELFATDNVCTHAYAMLTDGWLDGDEIECPLHGGRFNVRTGKALTSPVENDIRTFPVREADGIIEIAVPPA